MFDRMRSIASIAPILLSGALGLASGQEAEQPPRPQFALRVFVDPRVPEAQKDLHEKVKDTLHRANLGVPEDRIAYFQNFISPAERKVEGWTGIIESITQIKGGVLVDLRIHASQAGMGNMVHFNERYAIIRGKVRYVGSSAPPTTSQFRFSF